MHIHCIFYALLLPSIALSQISTGLLLNLSGGEMGPRAEKAISPDTALGLEFLMIASGDQMSRQDNKERGESLHHKGYELTGYLIKYSKSISGFFWNLGAGYRILDATYQRPKEEIPSEQYTDLNEDQLDSYDIKLQGTTVHSRVGYRFHLSQVGLTSFIGLRHFSASKIDSDHEEISLKEKARFGRVLMTKPELGLEVSYIF
jgi:hypothetical protein